MNLAALTDLVRQDPAYAAILEMARTPSRSTRSLDTLEAARPYLLAALQRDWPGPILAISGRPEQARGLQEQTRAWSAQPEDIHYFHAPDAIFYDRTPWDHETVQARVGVLARLAEMDTKADAAAGRGTIINASIWALLAKSVSPMAFRRATRTIESGQVIPLFTFLEQAVRTGYDPAIVVEEPGTFSHRGSIVDIYAPNMAFPVRIDFFGDEIDTIRRFDPGSQRSGENLERVVLAPASEALPEWGKAGLRGLRQLDLSSLTIDARGRFSQELTFIEQGTYFAGLEYYMGYLYPRSGTLFDFIPSNALVLIDDMVALETAAVTLQTQAEGMRSELIEDRLLPEGFGQPYLDWEDLKRRLAMHRAISLGYGVEAAEAPMSRRFVPAPRYSGQLTTALDDVAEMRGDGGRVVLVSRQAERLSDLLRDQNVLVTPTEDLADIPPRGALALVDGILAQGWRYPDEGLTILSDSEVFGWVRAQRRRPGRRQRSAPESLFADLKPGDYVVHVEYGIGRYHGMARKTINGLEREYLELEYASEDRLWVPIHQADRVSRYLGAGDRTPRVHRLGGTEWERVKEKAVKSVKRVAMDLLQLYASRELIEGHAFAPDNLWQKELEGSFPYQETDDQLRALAEVKRDMESPRPMDRIICGDVGYGKTEVALRAAFKAVMDGKQVAILVPTTVLAQQHYHTFRRRLRAFPVTVEMLSRFRTPQEQEQILTDMMMGRVDIVIGTHRLLSNDIAFKDLGLVIIDEEQRFGVNHKEHLKQIRTLVDVLTLTATPIPRTLYMSISGIRDMSIIDTPPEERLAVRTSISETDEALIRKAILREIDRDGQVYFVHNRVMDIETIAAWLQDLVPESTVVIGHGQMQEGHLAQVMLGFSAGEADVLLCTTIIESGLDNPNVNTIIIDRADTFGLAQLYQLRGRVGRGVNRGYAYLFYKPPLSEIAQKRLTTIREASELGAGFQVAMRDMEIRGAGELLGAEQSGQIAAVGYDLYTRLLKRAVEELQHAQEQGMDGTSAIRRAQHTTATDALTLGYGPSVDLPLAAFLPDAFLPDDALRLRLYRRLAGITTMEEVDNLESEWRDRFGKLPPPIVNLVYLLRVRILGAEASVELINNNPRQIVVGLPLPLAPDSANRLMRACPWARARGTRIWLDRNSDAWRQHLLELLGELTGMVALPEQG